MDAFHALTDADLAAVAAALRSGRLCGPFTAVAVQRYCGEQAASVAATLQTLHHEGMRPQHLALALDAVRDARGRRRPADEPIDLVWTGPEASGATNRDTAVVVRELFGSAETEVLVAGFAVYQGRSIFKRLAERMGERPGLRVRFFLDVQRHPADATSPDEVARRFVETFRSRDWPGERLPDLYCDPRSLDPDAAKRSSLHAKCVVIDRRVALVTSANFTEAAQTRNIEVGALIRSERFAARLAWHFESLAEAGLLRRLLPPDAVSGP